MEIKIYTDGACVGNPGPGGWAAVMLLEKERKELFGGEKLTTNNRMELTAAIKALEYFTNQEEKLPSLNKKKKIEAYGLFYYNDKYSNLKKKMKSIKKIS